MSTTKRTLVDLVLTASFRRERHSGLLLTDPLPDELPIDGTVEAQEAWGNLVSLQRRFIDVGAPDPWGVFGRHPPVARCAREAVS